MCNALLPAPAMPQIAGLIKEVIDQHELRAKLALLVTDNAASMVVARTLVIASAGFQHVLEMRWVNVYCFTGDHS
jgi:hypothetical protein